jgi:hypothetical protein
MVELPGSAPGSNPLILSSIYCYSSLLNIFSIGRKRYVVKENNCLNYINKFRNRLVKKELVIFL